MTNPYMEALKGVPLENWPFRGPQYKSFELGGPGKYRDHRTKLVTEFAWAIPNERAIRNIAQFAPHICEIGAGTGYWAYMLSQFGASVVAYDIAVPGKHDNGYKHTRTWFDVKHGDVLSINQHQNRALMLCWPPYANSMASACLKLYTGPKVIYIGEGDGGCTADDEFHEMLRSDFNLIQTIDIPQWDGIHDAVELYERNLI